MKTYRVLDDSHILEGTAEQVLTEIKNKSGRNEEINQMSVDQYAKALVDSAPYYLPKSAVVELDTRLTFNSLFDKALTVLSTIPSSGASIMSSEEIGQEA